jgi:hypothetical protein
MHGHITEKPKICDAMLESIINDVERWRQKLYTNKNDTGMFCLFNCTLA